MEIQKYQRTVVKKDEPIVIYIKLEEQKYSKEITLFIIYFELFRVGGKHVVSEAK